MKHTEQDQNHASIKDRDGEGDWPAITRQIRQGGTRAALHHRIVENTMSALAARDAGMIVRPRQRRMVPAWSVAALAAASLALVAGFAVVHGFSPDGTHTSNGMEINGEYHVDFSAEAVGNGAPGSPFGTLEEAVRHSPANATIKVAGGATTERLRLDRQVRLEAMNGEVLIGSS